MLRERQHQERAEARDSPRDCREILDPSDDSRECTARDPTPWRKGQPDECRPHASIERMEVYLMVMWTYYDAQRASSSTLVSGKEG